MWPVNPDFAKAEFYGLLRLEAPEPGQPFPAGWCHFPELEPEYFKQLTSEHLVTIRNRKGYTVHEWQVLPNRENHWLDCRVGARAAAARNQLDRIAAARAARPPPPPGPPRSAPSRPSTPEDTGASEAGQPATRSKGAWLGGRGGGMRDGRGFLSRRR